MNFMFLLVWFGSFEQIPICIYFFYVNIGNTRTTNEICSKLTIMTPERGSGVSLFNLNRFHTLVWCFHCWFSLSKWRLGPVYDTYKNSKSLSNCKNNCLSYIWLSKLIFDVLKDTLKAFDDFKNKQQKCMK